ncbi:MAG: DHH family phosphoesterase [Bacteroidota bacterium]
MESTSDRLLELFRKSGSFCITTHVNPDGDGIGSELALARRLAAGGKRVQILNHSETPRVYRFLDPQGLILRYDPARHSRLAAEAGLIVVLDANTPSRLGSLEEPLMASGAPRVCIDHHPSPSPRWHEALIDPDATSTGEMLYRLFARQGDPPLTVSEAEALYAAIMTDTGSFRYPRVSSETHLIVADLISRGADPVRIYTQVYEQWTRGRTLLLGRMLADIGMACDGALAYGSITRGMLDAAQCREEDTDNFTVHLMNIEGVRAGILFQEIPEGVKVSFRSRGNLPINELAREFGGGGHMHAAGARLEGERLEDARSRILASAARHIRRETGP